MESAADQIHPPFGMTEDPDSILVLLAAALAVVGTNVQGERVMGKRVRVEGMMVQGTNVQAVRVAGMGNLECLVREGIGVVLLVSTV